MHFLLSCKLYDILRLKFFNEITAKYSIFNEFYVNTKSLFLCNSIDPAVCRSTAAFVFQAMSLRPGEGGTPLYGLYRYVRPQRVWFFSRFGHKLGIDFSYFAAILVINRVSIFVLWSSIRFFF